MHLEDLQTLCNTLKGVTEDIKWEHDLCFCIGGKMFLVTSLDGTPCSASFKVKDEDFEYWCAKEGLIPAPYLARYKWVYVDDIKRLTRDQWKKVIYDSYRLISSKLPAKIKKELGL
jgi:predicted DNA-binding protein (MmcQ/YjbR family)